MISRTRWRVGGCAAALAALAICAGAGPHARAVASASPGAVATAQARREPGLRSFTVAMTGDTITEFPVLQAGAAAAAAAGTGARYDFSQVLAPVTPLIFAASLAICHEEIPIGYPGAFAGVYGRSPYGGNLLLAPYEIAPALKQAGFDRCTTSSNHSNDVGTPGIDSTLDVLDSMGISHVGTARTPAESAIALFTVNGVRVAHLGYTNYSNTVRPPSWEVNQPASVQDVIDDVNEARAMGAEVVIVSLHLGHELEHEPIPDDRAFVTELTAATKVDLVVEHGPHVIQPIEQVNGTWVYWSIGNFLDGMGQPGATRYGPDTLDGLIAWARFTEVGPNHFEVTPSSVLICDEIYGRVVYPALTTLQDPSISPQLRSELQECVARTLPLVPDIS